MPTALFKILLLISALWLTACSEPRPVDNSKAALSSTGTTASDGIVIAFDNFDISGIESKVSEIGADLQQLFPDLASRLTSGALTLDAAGLEQLLVSELNNFDGEIARAISEIQSRLTQLDSSNDPNASQIRSRLINMLSELQSNRSSLTTISSQLFDLIDVLTL